MQIRNFNTAPAPEASAVEPPPETAATAGSAIRERPDAGCATHGPATESLTDTEIKLLRARIEHLELVVETARGLMTANQERLLRRLHDVPREMMALTATITRLAAAEPGRAGDTGAGTTNPAMIGSLP